jgi:hypothetical protein
VRKTLDCVVAEKYTLLNAACTYDKSMRKLGVVDDSAFGIAVDAWWQVYDRLDLPHRRDRGVDLFAYQFANKVVREFIDSKFEQLDDVRYGR